MSIEGAIQEQKNLWEKLLFVDSVSEGGGDFLRPFSRPFESLLYRGSGRVIRAEENSSESYPLSDLNVDLEKQNFPNYN